MSVNAQDISSSGGIYAISSQGDVLDFKSLALESAETFMTTEYYNKQMLSIMPIGNEYIETSIEKIIGEDIRYQVADTTYFPWSTIVKIQGYWDANHMFNCSGWMLGASTVVTAAHCIYDQYVFHTFASSVVVTPALNSDSTNSEPFGSCEASTGWIVNLWRITGYTQYDYGVYHLRCRIGEETGNLGYRIMSDAELMGQTAIVAGYPMDKGGTTMWFGLGNVTNTLTDLLYYDTDTDFGQSGSPVREDISDWCIACVVAIHSRPGDGEYNVGVRITDVVFDFLFVMQQWVYRPVYIPFLLLSESSQQNILLEYPYPAPFSASQSTSGIPYPAPSP